MIAKLRSNSFIHRSKSTRIKCLTYSKEHEEIEQLLREQGKRDDVAQLDTSAINKIIQEKKWDNEILDVLKEYVKL